MVKFLDRLWQQTRSNYATALRIKPALSWAWRQRFIALATGTIVLAVIVGTVIAALVSAPLGLGLLIFSVPALGALVETCVVSDLEQGRQW